MHSPVVGVLNSAEDALGALKSALEDAGFRVVTAHIAEIQSGTLDLVAFVNEHDPSVIVYDLPRPLERHWNFLRLLRGEDFLKARCWVLTTVDRAAVAAVVTESVADIILGEPRTPGDVVDAVRLCLDQETAAK